MLMHVSVLCIVSMSRHVSAMCVDVGVYVTNIHTYIHAYTHDELFFFITLCKCVSQIYIILHDMRKKYGVGKGRRSRQKKNHFLDFC